MTDEQKYLFDLQGYIVLKRIIPPAVVDACNRVLDRFEEMPPDDYPPPLCLGTPRTEKELYISNILEADSVFNALIDIPEVLDVVEGVTGGPYRLNHTYTIYRWGGGYTGLHMHGTPIIPKCQYHCKNGQMVSTLTKAVFPMLDCDVGDGCFAAIPGAHKSNFPRPWEIIRTRTLCLRRFRRRLVMPSFSRRHSRTVLSSTFLANRAERSITVIASATCRIGVARVCISVRM